MCTLEHCWPIRPLMLTGWSKISKARGVQVVISQRPKRQTPLEIALEVYKWRHLIENFFGKLKDSKRIAMRSDKADSSFAAAIHLAAAVIHTR